MKAYASIMGGLCVLGEGQQRQLVNVIESSLIAPDVAHLISGAVDDWESVEAPDRENLLLGIKHRYNHARCLANVESCLAGVTPELQVELLGEVEELLETSATHNGLTAMLLRAPLASPGILTDIIKLCLTEGYAATAAIIEKVREFQPHLWRLSDRWLSIPDEYFAAFPGGRQQVWRLAVASEAVLESLVASSSQILTNVWAKLAFSFIPPAERSAVIRISKQIASTLFPNDVNSAIATSPENQDRLSQEQHERPQSRHDAFVGYERAKKQVAAITAAVAKGRDATAKIYLRELVESQLKHEGDEEYAVKSLCNIAQQCADMFRTDFEYECLQLALEVNANDGWMLIQLADHYKRVGRFDEAIKTLEKARSCGEDVVAISSQADVYAQMGQFDEAIRIYESIAGAEDDPAIRMAKATVLRRWGRFDDAEREYDSLIADSPAEHRAFAGKAEIAKQTGRFNESRDMYERILDPRIFDDVDERAKYIYRLSLANVYLRTGQLDEAYRLTDQAVQLRPFAQQAKAFRAAAEGLLGNPNKAIQDLPHLGQTKAFHEWVSDYVRGLLLLMLNRHADARKALLQKVEERFLDRDASGVLRLGAAVCFLRNRADLTRAEEILCDVPSMNDAFADAIRAALAYHVAVALHQSDKIAQLEKRLASVQDSDLSSLVMAIKQRNWVIAWGLEVRALLRLAS